MHNSVRLLVAIALTYNFMSQDVAADAQQRADSKNGIVLDFPNSSIGTLEKIIDGADYGNEHSPGTTFAKLSGKVFIPSGTILGVTVRDSLSDPLPILARIPSHLVQSLSLTGLANFNADTIKAILRFQNIKRLQMDRAELDDAGLARLTALPNLESIVVSHTQLKGSTLSSLCSLKKLTRLDIGSNEIKGDSLSALACLKSLQRLSLVRCHLRNPHISFLPALTNLQQLEICENDLLSDPCMKYVARLPKLKILRIDSTHISAKGLMLLKGAQLKSVRVNPTQFSETEQAQVKKVFPGMNLRINNKQTKNYGIFKELFEKDKP